MAFIKGTSFYVHITAWKTSGKATGDEDNITCYLICDGESAVEATNNATLTEESNGDYVLLLTAAETDADLITISGTSTTTGVFIPPVRIQTSENIDDFAADILDTTLTGHTTTGTVGEVLSAIRQASVGKKVVTKVSDVEYTIEVYDTDDTTVLYTMTIDIASNVYTRTVE